MWGQPPSAVRLGAALVVRDVIPTRERKRARRNLLLQPISAGLS